MISQTFTFKARDGVEVFVYKWLPSGGIKGIMQIAHGVSEHGGRYESFARDLVSEGYIVYANDHRGHGRTAKTLDNLIYLGDNGWNLMAEDSHLLTRIIKRENPNTPLFFFGHSMGSFIVRQCLYEYPNEIDGAILAGTGLVDKLLINAGILIAERLIDKNNSKKRSFYLNKMVFGTFNSKVPAPETFFDWISRDKSTVQNFISDPFCGIPCTNNFFYEFLNGMKEIQRTKNMVQIPKSTPLLLVSGDKDPVGHWGKDVPALVKQYKRLGIKDVRYKLYKEGRHEVVNDINRDEVIKDILRWMNFRNAVLSRKDNVR